MTIDLDRLEAVAKAATPGEWTYNPVVLGMPNMTVLAGGEHAGYVAIGQFKDGEHVAAFDPPTVLALIALARRAEEAERTLAELRPDPVLVEGSWFPVDELPTVLGSYIRATAEAQREAKAYLLRAEEVGKRAVRLEENLVREMGAYKRTNSQRAARLEAAIREALDVLDSHEQGEADYLERIFRSHNILTNALKGVES